LLADLGIDVASLAARWRLLEWRISRAMTPVGCVVDGHIVANVSDSEIDMNRVTVSAAPPRIWRLIAAIRRFTPGIYSVHTPRRSVDRENQQFPEPWE
jgi:hypothetical protein